MLGFNLHIWSEQVDQAVRAEIKMPQGCDIVNLDLIKKESERKIDLNRQYQRLGEVSYQRPGQ